MKTLLLTLEFPPFKGGVANYYGNLARYWPAAENLIILDNHQGQLQRGSGFLAWWPALSALKQKIKQNRIDYVLVGQILPLGTAAYLLSWFKPLKYAVFLHGLDWHCARLSPRKRFLSGLILKRAHKIICANNYLATLLKTAYPARQEKINIVNPGVAGDIIDTVAFKETEYATLQTRYHLKEKILMFSLGRLVERKGLDYSIQALTQIPAPLLNDLVYFIAGVGPAEQSLRALVPPEFRDKIIFLGELSEEEKWAWLNLSDIFIMPARNIKGDFEGFGIVYLEANLCGRPVIAGRSGGVSDAVVDNYNGLLVDPENIASIKTAIIKLATDAALRKKLGEQGRARALKDFNWERQARRLFKIIKD